MIECSIEDLGAYDEHGPIAGFQFPDHVETKWEWVGKKEDEQYKLLFTRLQRNNQKRRYLASSPERRERHVKLRYSWRDRNREKVNARRRELARERYEANPVVNKCIVCGVEWTVPFEQTLRRARFCGKRCRKRHYRRVERKGGV